MSHSVASDLPEIEENAGPGEDAGSGGTPGLDETPSHLDLDIHDLVRLADGVHVVGGEVTDQWLGIVGRPNPAAAWLISMMVAPITVGDLISRFAAHSSYDADAAGDAVRVTIEQLDRNGQVLVRRPLRTWLLPVTLWQLVISLAMFRPVRRPARRYRLSAAGVIRAAGRQGRWPALVFAVLGALVALLVMAQQPVEYPPERALRAGAVLPTLLFLHCGLIAVHEIGHVAALRAIRGGGGLVAIRGVRIGVVFPRSAGGEPVIALAGPATAFLASLSVGALAGLASAPMPFDVLRYAPLLGIAHLCCLVPWSADGKLLIKGLRVGSGRAMHAPE